MHLMHESIILSPIFGRGFDTADFLKKEPNFFPKVFTPPLSQHMLHFISKGKRVVERGGKRFELKSSDAFFFFKGNTYNYYRPQSDIERYTIHFPAHSKDIFSSTTTPSKNSLLISEYIQTGNNASVKNLFLEISTLCASSRESKRLKAEALFYELLIELSSLGSSSKPSLYDRAVDFIENNYHKNIGLEDASKYLNCSNSEISRAFSENASLSFPSYVRQMKMKVASDMIRLRPYATIVSTAKTLGYHDEYYFSRLFKKIVGESPSSYRKRFR